MGYHGLHRNKLTGELLAQDVQICPMCHKNFSSDDAWEKHWDRKKPKGFQCSNPDEIGLTKFTNTFGSEIYRTKR